MPTLVVRVNTKAKSNSVIVLGENQYKVSTTVAPEKGKANGKILELLAKHLGVRKSQLTLISGHTNQTKTFNLE